MYRRGDEFRRIAERLEKQTRSGILRHRWEAEALQPPGPPGLLARMLQAVLRRLFLPKSE